MNATVALDHYSQVSCSILYPPRCFSFILDIPILISMLATRIFVLCTKSLEDGRKYALSDLGVYKV